MVTSPLLKNDTNPSWLTLATCSFELDQVTNLEASLGSVSTFKSKSSPTHWISLSEPLMIILLGVRACSTIILIDALQFESIFNVAVMVTSPWDKPLTNPFLETLAMFSSELVQVTSFWVVPETDDLNWIVFETLIVVDPIAVIPILYGLSTSEVVD